LEKTLTVAIYTGSIPGPMFIENLIQALAGQGVRIYLFGRKKSSVNYTGNNIFLFSTPNHPLLLIGFILTQIIRLIINDPGKFVTLLTHYQNLSKNELGGSLNWWGKVLPIVNNLPDIFHIQWAKALPKWFFLKDLFRVKMVVSLRGSHINYSPLADDALACQYRSLFPRVNRFHAVSWAIVNEAGKYDIVEQKSDVIYSAVNLESLQCYRKTNWKTNIPFHFISVGRYHWTKGYHYALSAIKNLQENNFHIHYTIIAHDHPSEEILYNIDELFLHNHVTLLCLDTQDDVYRKMSLADCLLLPSIEEGIANVVLEAMAIGLPVVSSECGGMMEIIEHEKDGFLFRNRDVDHLTQTMTDMINQHSDERESMSKRARLKMEKNHDYSRLGNKMKELYQSLDLA